MNRETLTFVTLGHRYRLIRLRRPTSQATSRQNADGWLRRKTAPAPPLPKQGIVG